MNDDEVKSILEDVRLNDAQKAVMLACICISTKKGVVYATDVRLAYVLNCERFTISEARKKLCSIGLLHKRNGGSFLLGKTESTTNE